MKTDPSVFSRPRPASVCLALLTGIVVALGLAPGCDRQGAPQPGASTSGGAGGPGGPAASEPVRIALGSSVARPRQRAVSVVGTLFGDEEAVVSNKVPGKVIGIFKDVGDAVAPGEPMAQLLRNDYELSLRQREAALQEVLAKLGLSSPPGSEFDIEALPSVRRAALQMRNAEARYQRAKQLFEEKVSGLSPQDFENARTEWEVALSAYEVERLASRGLLGEVKTRQAELAIADQALRDTTLRAPRPSQQRGDPEPTTGEAGAVPADPAPPADPQRSWVVVERLISDGELKSAISPFFRLVDLDPLRLRAAVPERYVGAVRRGQKARASVEAYAQVFEGYVERVNPRVDIASRTFEVEIALPNPQGKLAPGSFARADILTHVDDQAVFVPAQAVYSFAGVDRVFTVKDGKAVELPVELGDRVGDDIEVVRGLKAGVTLAIGNVSKLATGVPVKVESNAPAPVESPSSRLNPNQKPIQKPGERPIAATEPASTKSR